MMSVEYNIIFPFQLNAVRDQMSFSLFEIKKKTMIMNNLITFPLVQGLSMYSSNPNQF